jgi:hypothetical protein
MPTSELGRLHWMIIGIVWLAAAFGSGAALAWFYQRLYRGLSFYKLWAFWTVVASVVAAAVFALGLV